MYLNSKTYFKITNWFLDCCARRLLSLQPDFLAQKCEIEEKITGLSDTPTRHRVMYYPKFHCELNHIQCFWCNGKCYTQRNCKYTIERLWSDVSTALSQIRLSAILNHYKSCLRKMDLYCNKVKYGTSEWKKLTSHKKTWSWNNDQWWLMIDLRQKKVDLQWIRVETPLIISLHNHVM